MSRLPHEVIEFRQIVLQSPSHKLHELAKKLTVSNPTLATMWKSVARHSRRSGPWVQEFLDQVDDAASAPAYFHKNLSERRELRDRISNLAKKLARVLKANDLDAQLIYGTGALFPGFRIYEDFGESNRAHIDDQGLEKLSIVNLLSEIEQRSKRLIDEAPKLGKAGKNHRAIRFARALTVSNTILLKGPRYAVTATITNALYRTHYNKSDIRKLIKRSDLKHPLGWAM